ncbi:MAG: NADH-quinone oxidoreductase subunit NuoN [Leptothrix ochracea]|uniref:NADH-quinone oxidoreductase subunit NuoN n=1 Tax=Leptothrix ochracea TaxID=735331 RepID=UPI0034E21777
MTAMNWLAVSPEILLLVMTCVIAIVDLFVVDPRRLLTYGLSLATLLAVAFDHAMLIDGKALFLMNRMMVSDAMGQLLALVSTLSVAVTLIYARAYAGEREMLKGELFTLSLFALLGMNIMVSSNNMLLVYLGLELMSLSLYALTALRRDNSMATEAAMKYFVLGAIASGFLLYGMSMVYGATGTLDLDEAFQRIGRGDINHQVLVFGLVFVVSGLAFKFGAVPFHMWVPDVYHGAPTAATLLIAGAPKIATFGMAMRLLVDGMLGLAVDWQQMLAILAVASLLVGNLAAIAQTNLKRMLAYSTIAQMGFMLLGLISGVAHGNTELAGAAYGSAMFYMITYVITTLGTFGVILVLSRYGFESEHLSDLAGLNRRNPLLAGVMAVFMLSLAGIPPLAGFYAKLSVLQALVATGSSTLIALAVFAVVMSLIGAFYYLRVIKVMYFEEPEDESLYLEAPADARFMLTLNGALVLGLGVLPGGLMTLCQQSIIKALSNT